MMSRRQITIPTLVRIKPGALDRMGIYAVRHGLRQVVVLASHELPGPLSLRLQDAFKTSGVEILQWSEVAEASFEQTQGVFGALPAGAQVIVGLGGGKALDTAKYVAFLARLPYIAVPTSLSNDGFCSPQSSLTLAGKRRSLPSRMPFGVVMDTAVTLDGEAGRRKGSGS
jgi:glycerol-1-phosphate dehydrogenase [NAD(P)+]